MDFIYWPLEIKRFANLLFIALILFLFIYFKTLPHSTILIWMALLFAFQPDGATITRKAALILFTGMIAFVATAIASILKLNIIFLYSWIFLFLVLSTWFIYLHKRYFYNIFAINIILIVSINNLSVATHQNDYFIYTLIATGIVIVSQIVYGFHFWQDRWRAVLLKNLRNLQNFTEDIFASFTTELSENLYRYERKIHISKKNCLSSLSQLRQFILFIPTKKKNQKQTYSNIAASFNKIFELLISCSLLRMRISDYSIFEVADDEIRNIANHLQLSFIALARRLDDKCISSNSESLENSIKRFEAIYERVLRVASPEPLVLLLFNKDLIQLKEELLHCQTLLDAMS